MSSEEPGQGSQDQTEPRSAGAELAPKIKRAAQLLLAQRGLTPGAKGWELKKTLGRDYKAILDALNVQLEALGLQVKAATPEESQDPEDARYYLLFREPPPTGVSLGIRIDDVAILAASLAYIKARGGRCGRSELETMLRDKFPKWKIMMGLRRFEKMGYMQENEGTYSFGWRTKVEVNLSSLSTLIAALPPATSKTEET